MFKLGYILSFLRGLGGSKFFYSSENIGYGRFLFGFFKALVFYGGCLAALMLMTERDPDGLGSTDKK